MDALRASGVSISRVSPAIPVIPEDTKEQTDSNLGWYGPMVSSANLGSVFGLVRGREVYFLEV